VFKRDLCNRTIQTKYIAAQGYGVQECDATDDAICVTVGFINFFS